MLPMNITTSEIIGSNIHVYQLEKGAYTNQKSHRFYKTSSEIFKTKKRDIEKSMADSQKRIFHFNVKMQSKKRELQDKETPRQQLISLEQMVSFF
jgi:hypothetical protein